VLMKDVITRLVEACPPNNVWGNAKGEPYGSYFAKYSAECKRALYCVTPTPEVREYFRKGGYDLLISHHPFVAGVPQFIMHTALDCCEGGMNDQWADALEIKDRKHFDDNLGWYGTIDPLPYNELVKKVERFIEAPCEGVCYSDIEVINSVVVCSGLGGYVEKEALKTGADCYVFGEGIWHPAYSDFKAQIETGHTLSESKPGYLFVKKVLEPEVTVDRCPMGIDTFQDEVFVAGKGMAL
jgi:putative NIF3 family GTP cyclohydrolase 1 type 2